MKIIIKDKRIKQYSFILGILDSPYILLIEYIICMLGLLTLLTQLL